MRVAVATALAAATHTANALHKAKLFNKLSHLHDLSFNTTELAEDDICPLNQECDFYTDQDLVSDMKEIDFYRSMLENAGKVDANPRIQLRNVYNTQDREAIAPCPDLLKSFNNFNDMTTFIPVWGIGVIGYGGAFSKNEIIGMRYSQETYAACSGLNNGVGSICKLECENGSTKLFGQTLGVENRQIKKFEDMDDPKTAYETNSFDEFKCMCAGNPETGDKYCWWAPKAIVWFNPRTCDANTQMSARVERPRLRSRWIDRRTKERGEFNGQNIEEMWDDYIKNKPEYMATGDITVLSDENGYKSGVLESDEEFIADGGYPDEPTLNEFLKQDPVFLQNQNDLSRQMDNLETGEDREMLDMLKKTEHLFKMIGFMLQHTVGGEDHLPSKFFNYGCWCSQHTKNIYQQGHGRPMDQIDNVCFLNKNCRKCAQMDNGNSCHSHKGYSFKAEVIGGQPTITCLDEFTGSAQSGCRQSLCQCDVEMVTKLVENRDTYNIDLSTGLSGLFSTEQCPENQCLNSPEGCNSPDICCGNYPHRHPQFSNNGQNQCCGDNGKIIDPSVKQCCNGVPKMLGTCDAL